VKTALLEAVTLSHAFAKGRPVLSDITLGFSRGELSVLAGRNGAGKTVLAKCLAGLLEPTSGEVRFEGAGLSGLKGSLATRVAYVFQDARLQVLGDTVLDDLLFGLDAIGLEKEEALDSARRALAAVGLEGKETVIPWHLSGGELRRLAIAAVLALDPPVLILDEPFANLDWASVSEVLEILVELRERGQCLIVLTHELDKVLGLADRLIVLDEGRVFLEGDPGRVLERGIEAHGLRDPLRPHAELKDLLWLERGR
jgi:biotin transport system ATP-binding protein